MTKQLYYMSVEELTVLVQAREISPVEIVNACLSRVEHLNPRLNAFATVLRDQAREQAKQAETEIQAGHWRGPLHGVPVGIKDFYDVAGVKTTAASEMFQNRVPSKDAVGVAKLRAAGAIVVGKMNMHQLGMGTTGLDSFFGPIRNPWNASFIPGGSSSGSAAAVAAGMCYATLDTDAIGSCRLPAACCGVVGFKGTYGLISTKGILEGEQVDQAILWLSHAGIMTRSVGDTALMVNVLAEPGEEAPVRDLHHDLFGAKPLRVGIVSNFRGDGELVREFQTAVDLVRALGHEVVTAQAPFDIPPFGDLHAIKDDRTTVSGRVFRDIDLLVLPTTSTLTLPVNDARSNPLSLSTENTIFANYFGLPAISVPCGFDKNGIPIGLQIVGKPWDEGAVLQLAHEYEVATESRMRHPIP
jgi:aspartyl-tRNA(Asn)/glutamyl-tRNA(Gln) amidotransferase subunit A